MADWLRYNTNTQQDSDWLALLRTNGGFTFWFEGLLCIAKSVADEDPERYQGHLVTSAGIPLTEEDLARLLAQYSRKHRQLVAKFLEVCLQRGMLVSEPWRNGTRTDRESHTNGSPIAHEPYANDSRTVREPIANVLRINNFSRWWRAPERSKKTSSGEGLPKPSEQKKTPPPKTDFSQPAALQTDIQTDRQIPPNPQGPAEQPKGMLSNYPTLNPDTFGDPIDEPEDKPNDHDLPASDDKSKLSGHLTRREFSILRGRADQLLQQLSPGGLARGQTMALNSYLETLPPKGWKEPPRRWAELLCHFVKRAAGEVEEQLGTRKDHNIGNPAAVAIARAKTLAAEKLSEAKRG